jgi:hypothetical protein
MKVNLVDRVDRVDLVDLVDLVDPQVTKKSVLILTRPTSNKEVRININGCFPFCFYFFFQVD